MASGRSSKNSELEAFHIYIIYHQGNISRASVGWLWERPSNDIVRSAAITNSVFLTFFFWSLLNCQAIQSHCLGPKWSISKAARKELLVPWGCPSSELWSAFYGHLSDSCVGEEFTVLALLPPRRLPCIWLEWLPLTGPAGSFI